MLCNFCRNATQTYYKSLTNQEIVVVRKKTNFILPFNLWLIIPVIHRFSGLELLAGLEAAGARPVAVAAAAAAAAVPVVVGLVAVVVVGAAGVCEVAGTPARSAPTAAAAVPHTAKAFVPSLRILEDTLFRKLPLKGLGHETEFNFLTKINISTSN